MENERRSPFHDGPFLETACLCERVLIEKDGVKSAIRIIDRINRTAVGPNPPQEMEPFPYELNMLIKMKSGKARGPMALQIRLEKPSGESPPPIPITVNFEGDDDRGVDVVTKIAMNVDIPGLYWIELRLNGVRLTRVPLRVTYLPQITQIPPQREDPEPPTDSN